MRPTKLVVNAFGPYAGTTEIDFDALGTSGVYLVCGDTGSGKTMIFDAICFALFGEASGDVRGGARATTSLRSDYAERTSRTYVELWFDYRGKPYRIKRNPEYERAKERGTGTTKQKAEAEIQLPDGRVVTGVRNVNNQVEDLLGIDSEQFKQIVMLAQGEFRKLLTADTETRQVIFRKLFGTERYEMLQTRLAEESRKLEHKNSHLKTKIATLIQQANLPESVEIAESQRGLWLRGELEKLLEEDRQQHDKLQAEVADLRIKWSEASTLIKQVENRPVLLREKADLEAKVGTLKTAAPALAQAFEDQKLHDGERSQAGERAAVIEGTFAKYEQLQQAVQASDQAKHQMHDAQQVFDQAKVESGSLASALEQLTVEVGQLNGADVRAAQEQAKLDAARAQADAATKALANARELQKKQQETESAAEALEQASSARNQAEEVAKGAGEALAQAQEVLAGLADAPLVLAEVTAQLGVAHRVLDDAKSLEAQRVQLAGQVEAARSPYAGALEKLKEAEAAHDADAVLLHDLQKRQRAGRAGLLAQELEEGQPCPVCGSEHHPNPARVEGAIPSDAEIDAAAAKEEASSKRATDASRKAERLKSAFDERTAQLEAFDVQHGGAEGVQAALVNAQAVVAEAAKAKEAAQARSAQADVAGKALKDAQAKHDAADKQLADANAAYQRARESHIAAENAAHTLRDSVGALDVQTAQSACDLAAAHLLEAQQAANEARRQSADLAAKQEELATANTNAGRAAEELAKAKDALQKATMNEVSKRNEVTRLKAELEFESLESAKREAARLRQHAAALKTARDETERAVSNNASQLATQEELLKAKVQQIESLPVANVEETRQLRDECYERGDAISKQASAVKSRIDANQNCLNGLLEALEEAGDIEAQYGRVKMLADVATGNLVGQAKVRFEAYVQAIYFDKVIAAANERLKMLTSGQFELVRYSEGAGNTKAGLGLYVIDSFTGRARDASSLSGGESFQASLCLALGLSDIVQAHAGGIEFDTMFVDEGFGSLDQGALGNAISLLSDLSGGTKLVGIISHVEDLKANIPKKIVVTKTRTGSSVAMQL